MNLASNKTVREVALENPGATRVFEHLGIDYCCGGNRLLADACATVGITLDEVEKRLWIATAPHAQFEETNFRTATLAELIDLIVEKHHAFAKTEIARLRTLIEKVYSAHGENHSELAELRELFEALSAELEPHMTKEECVLFPYTIKVEDAVRNGHTLPQPLLGTIANPVRRMMLEHEDAGALLKEMRRVSGNYTIPQDACISYQTLYQALDEFEKDLHQHIHLENNILFPRAVEMERVAEAAPVR
jgi:regulator of cell morphogenesis and NO signaling